MRGTRPVPGREQRRQLPVCNQSRSAAAAAGPGFRFLAGHLGMPLGRSGALLDQLIGLARTLLEGEGVVKLAHRGAAFEPERVTVDGDHLEKLRPLGGPLLLGLGVQHVLLGTGHRVDVHRAGGRIGGDARLAGGGRLEPRPGVRMVVALKHKIDMVLVENRLPELTNLGIVASLGRRVDRMVKGDDRPSVRVVAQDLPQPLGLLLDLLVRVQRDDPAPW